MTATIYSGNAIIIYHSDVPLSNTSLKTANLDIRYPAEYHPINTTRGGHMNVHNL